MKIQCNALLVFGMALFGMLPPASAAGVEEGFTNPPEETKPWCYWYWLNGDITSEGITKDLEAMARVGIKRAMIGNIHGQGGSVGSVKMFSPEWYALTRHALSEANRLSIELMSFNAPGWSQSGGPWIQPEQSMRRVSWNEIPAGGGAFSQAVRPADVAASQDIAVLAVPRPDAVTLVGSPAELSLQEASWIWHPAENGASSAPAGTRYFKRVIELTEASMPDTATMLLTADNIYALSVNGQQVAQDDDWQTVERIPIRQHLQPGSNTISIAVTNTAVGPAGLIAAVELKGAGGATETIVTDASWLAATTESGAWVAASAMGPAGMAPWRLSAAGGGVLRFAHTEPFTARGLVVHGKANAKLYAMRNGQREFVADIVAAGGSARTDFLPNGIETFSFGDITAQEFELEPDPGIPVELTSVPTVAQVIEKQMGRMHPTPSPTWESYIFPATVEPGTAAAAVRPEDIINLSEYLGSDGTLDCTLPDGDWTVIYFGMVTTGKQNQPAPPEATGLEVDKMNRTHVEHHFDSSIGPLLAQMTPQERSAFKGITIDSYEVGAQNWTDGFAAEFATRNGYDPIALLPVMTGRVVGSAAASDQFLWDLRRTVADMIAENYVGGLRDIAHRHGLTLWCENYGHWGFPGEFSIYGGYTDEIGGEFWTTGNLGAIECRAASSVGHTYGKRRVYAEAFTSGLRLQDHPYSIKARGEQMFCEGINHFVLHVYAHQPRDGVPGNNPWFGTAFHRNTPWFNESRAWMKYLQRMHHMLQQGEPVADVAVYIGDFAPQMTGPANPVPAGHDYDHIGSDAILRKLQVIDGEWVVHDEHDPTKIAARWKVLALPEAGYLRPQVRSRLDLLKSAGGRVIDSVPVTATALSEAGIAPIVSATSFPARWKARRLNDGMLFFLSNFGGTGTFEATLRVDGKAPTLFNPATGEITKLARFRTVPGGTRVTLDVKDRSDSFFVVFRDAPVGPSVVAASAPPAALKLSYAPDNRLMGESGVAGTYDLTMSDGTTRQVVVARNSQTFAIESPWQETRQDASGFSVLRETAFTLPDAWGDGERVTLDLGEVSVMAKVTLNGQTFDTLWMPPFTLDVTAALNPGENQLQVLVTSTSEGTPSMGPGVSLRTTRKIEASTTNVQVPSDIPVGEPSFEGAKALGGWVPDGTPAPGQSTSSVPAPWVETGSFGSGWTADNQYGGGIPDGDIYAWANGAGTLSQTLAANLRPDTTYTLTVATGWRTDLSEGSYPTYPGYGIELWAGGVLLASNYHNTPGNSGPPAGTWKDVTATHTSPASVQAGQQLEIRLIGYGIQSNYDNVRLVAAPVAPPDDFNSYISNPDYGLAAAEQGFTHDPDGDGLPNGIEAWFGTHPGQSGPGISNIDEAAGTVTFTHPQNASPPSDLSGSYQWSPDLAAWYAGDGQDGPPGGPFASIFSETTDTGTTVTATPSETLEHFFLRVVVTQN